MVRLSRDQIKGVIAVDETYDRPRGPRQDWAQVQYLEATGRRGRRAAGAQAIWSHLAASHPESTSLSFASTTEPQAHAAYCFFRLLQRAVVIAPVAYADAIRSIVL